VRAAFDFRETFAGPAGQGTARAFAVFSLLLAALLSIGGELAFRELSIDVLRKQIDLGRAAAVEIAKQIADMGRSEGRIDYHQLRLNRGQVQRMIRATILRTRFIRHVEVRDRYGVKWLSVARDPGEPPAGRRGNLPIHWPEEEVIQVPLERGNEGQVRLGISEDAIEQELEDLRRGVRVQVAVAGLMALGVLILAFVYVLHLIRKNRNLEQARQSAARASYVGLLASGLAHEIRNPLNAMNMNLQMLEEELLAHPDLVEPAHVELLESTKSEIKRLGRLVNNFLAYARPAQPRFEPRDLNGIVREVVRLLEVDFHQSGVELRTDLEPLLPQVDADEAQFKQALINLLVNARQVLKSGGHVTLRTRAGVRGEVELEVTDNGPGIPSEIRERIFEVFYSSRGGGTGLGLPIARQIVERHGGTIEVESQENQGTTFRIRLPRRHVATMRQAAP
jgi:signal transduction histidine kinase